MVGLVFGEGDGEVLDVVCCTEFFEEQDELAQFFNEPVLIISRGDGDQHHHVVGEVGSSVLVAALAAGEALWQKMFSTVSYNPADMSLVCYLKNTLKTWLTYRYIFWDGK